MLYGISTALNQMHFSNDSVFANLGFLSGEFSAEFHTPAPDRPSSTR
jgi:hypothetical protein